ncbi:Bcr/CflA family multidrug efflux MFS transporter [Rodentibacter myodis]|uniref:Bcr/CflA family efflux transporter n=1 Tax=Rodentibacter myodis TaxID=1907939 RepID=A0A1V3JQ97_9PAST|nr:Bcr/CflA family multidrug efflux MFS transporter [Rodentibacter myodis]OOF58577.1 Bcr/CflA family drug resistance efflux transporter [Rodentibacter myodis]
MNKIPVTSHIIFIITLGLLSMLPPLAVDMYLPALLAISTDLNVEAENSQYTLTFFAYGMALGQLCWGPISDSMGRKPIILLGIAISSFIALCLPNITSIITFTLLRFIQGFFASASVVVVGALLRDLFNKNELSKIMSSVSLVFMVAPLLAPIIGGYIVTYAHWSIIFYIIGFMGVVSLYLVWRLIPETHRLENRIPLNWRIVVQNFIQFWQRKTIRGYILATSFSFGGLFAVITTGSIVYIGVYGISPAQFGYFFILNILVMIGVAFLNRKWVVHWGTEMMLRIGLTLQFIAGVWLVLTQLFDLGFWSMTFGIALFVGQNSLISTNTMASVLTQFPTLAGTANSLIGGIRFATGAIVGSCITILQINSAAPMLYTMFCCTLIASIGYYGLTYRCIR